ncbi:MAG: CapA family protein [Coleofasciculus sp. S288]|nr:CapA family protein [Coleofasciculus sp. S288]
MTSKEAVLGVEIQHYPLLVETLPNLIPEFPLKPPPPDVNIKIKAVGDIVPGTNYPSNRLHPQKKLLFQAVQPILKGADLLFGNFESTLTNHPYSPKRRRGGLIVAFRTPPSYTQILKEAGFDVMSVANNYSFDFSRPGFNDTIQNLEKTGIKALGKQGQILIAYRKGLSIAWIGFSIHLNRQGIPYRDRYFRSVGLIRQLTQSNFPQTPLVINKKGQILRK